MEASVCRTERATLIGMGIAEVGYGIIMLGDENMISIQIKGHVGDDGLLTLKIPTSYRDAELEATLIINPIGNADETVESNPNGWPAGFIEATAGSITDETFRRWPQGEYEERNPL
jgi:hypothetical protein